MKKLIPFIIFISIPYFSLHLAAQVNIDYSSADLQNTSPNGKYYNYIAGEDDNHYLMLRRNKDYEPVLALFSKDNLSFEKSLIIPVTYMDLNPLYPPFKYPYSVRTCQHGMLMPYRDFSKGNGLANINGLLYQKSGEFKSFGSIGSMPFKNYKNGLYETYYSSDSNKVILLFVNHLQEKEKNYGKINVQVFNSDYAELCNLPIDLSVFATQVRFVDADDEFIYIVTGGVTHGVDYGASYMVFGNSNDQFLIKISMKDGAIQSQRLTNMKGLEPQQLILRNNEIIILGTFMKSIAGSNGIFIRKFNRSDLSPTMDKFSYFDQAFIEELLSEEELKEERSYFTKNPSEFAPAIPNLDISKVYFDDLNSMYIVMEAKYTTREGFSSDNMYYVYHRNHVVVGKWDADGNLVWNDFIRKRSESTANNEYASTIGASFVMKNKKFHFLYYDTEENIMANDKEKNKSIGDGHSNLVLMYKSIDFEGNSETKVVHYKKDLQKNRCDLILSQFYVNENKELIVGVSDDGIWVRRIARITFPN
jgi:hypothetical protein